MANSPLPAFASAGLAAAMMAFAPVEAQELEEKPRKRVLVLHSLGPNFSPFDDFAVGLQRELRDRAATQVEFFEMSLESTRLAASASEEPFVEYLSMLFRDDPLDLVISIGGAAARFCLRHRDRLFSSTPLLTTGLEQRVLSTSPPLARAAALVVVLDLPRHIDHILRVLPRTKEIVVITGSAGLGTLWFDELRREFQPFADRVQFTGLFDLPLVEIAERVAALPPDTAILYGGITVDAAGVPYERDEALDILCNAANAPIFGLFDAELGRGIVGGPLISVSEASRRAADAALRILGGEAPETVPVEPITIGSPQYDYRELARWGIAERLLTAGSTVRFRPPSMWEEHRTAILAILSIFILETGLIAGLVFQRSRRHAAERKGAELTRRLLTAHEDERRRLARELHDDMSQRLARLAIDAGQMEGRLKALSGATGVSSISEDLGRLSEDVHSLSYQLHPSLIEDLGLDEALQVECERFSDVDGISAELEATDLSSQPSPEASLCLFRVAQEALRNAARHSQATRVRLSLNSANAGVRLVVSDDGVGFDPARIPGGTSLGLSSMRERLSLVDGELEIESGPGRGTTIRAWVPSTAGAT